MFSVDSSGLSKKEETASPIVMSGRPSFVEKATTDMVMSFPTLHMITIKTMARLMLNPHFPGTVSLRQYLAFQSCGAQASASLTTRDTYV